MRSSDIPKSVQRSMPYIKMLTKARLGVNKLDLLKRYPNFVINDIIEILLNVIKGNIPARRQEIKKLERFKRPLNKLVKIPTVVKRRNFIYKQKGGFIGAVLPVIASLVGGLAANAF